MTGCQQQFHIHGDNIVECLRVFNYIVLSLGELVCMVTGPASSVTCPRYTIKLKNSTLHFQLLPGFGGHRWNQDILNFVKSCGGLLRESADAIITRVGVESEIPVIAIEFCGALPAGNQAWQRQGRAYSFALADIPYFYVSELGGFELDKDRNHKAPRHPNPVVPFSFVTVTEYTGTVSLPVYEANAGASSDTIELYKQIFGTRAFFEYLKHAILNIHDEKAEEILISKTIALVKLLAGQRKRRDSLTATQWQSAHEAIVDGQNLVDYLNENVKLEWRKTAHIKTLTETARLFMELGSSNSLGLTSTNLPLSFVPKLERASFSRRVCALYSDLDPSFASWLASQDSNLVIAWINGFKPGGDDARPDRGVPGLARMLVGPDCEVLTFVYGPVPKVHWIDLTENPEKLATKNGLWEAILNMSDGLLVDTSTKPKDAPRCFLKKNWIFDFVDGFAPLQVEAKVLKLGEQDVDTALHLLFDLSGIDSVYVGMCNPPGGDWSGINFQWTIGDPEYRWLTLPRVTVSDEKRPDHVIGFLEADGTAVCLCVESKEHARMLDVDIGHRLTKYVRNLFHHPPSVFRNNKEDEWTVYAKPWKLRSLEFVSAGTYLSIVEDPFKGLSNRTALDLQIGLSFTNDGTRCKIHLRGDTQAGRDLIKKIVRLREWENFATVEISN